MTVRDYIGWVTNINAHILNYLFKIFGSVAIS